MVRPDPHRPISPPPATGALAEDLPAYVSNGVIGLRVRDVPLQQVLEQLADYQGSRLILLNGAAGQRRVSGSFNLDQADTAFDALISSQKLRADALLDEAKLYVNTAALDLVGRLGGRGSYTYTRETFTLDRMTYAEWQATSKAEG